MDLSASQNHRFIAMTASFILHSVIFLFFFQNIQTGILEKKMNDLIAVDIQFEPEPEVLPEDGAASEIVNEPEGNSDNAKMKSSENLKTNKNSSEPAKQKNKSTPVASKNSEEIVKSKPSKNENSGNPNSQSQVNNGSTTDKSKEELDNKKSQYGGLFGKGSGSGSANGDGTETGEPDASKLKGISKGSGIVGDGLNGRKAISIPTIAESSQKEGKVNIKVCVDQNGKVTSTKFTQKGSTSSDAYLVSISEKAAYKYQFEKGREESQCGTILFTFKLQ